MQSELKYRIRNWPEYNRALIKRGSIIVWMEEKALNMWFSSSHSCKAGRPETYSDKAILMIFDPRGFEAAQGAKKLETQVNSIDSYITINLKLGESHLKMNLSKYFLPFGPLQSLAGRKLALGQYLKIWT